MGCRPKSRTQAQARQCEAREGVRELGIGYHPVDLERGQAQPVEQVAQRFNGVWAQLGRIAAAANLPTRARERLAKAQRLTTQLLATLTFFFATLQLQIEALALPPDLERVLVEQLIPALYLERVAARSTHAEPRHLRNHRPALIPGRRLNGPVGTRIARDLVESLACGFQILRQRRAARSARQAPAARAWRFRPRRALACADSAGSDPDFDDVALRTVASLVRGMHAIFQQVAGTLVDQRRFGGQGSGRMLPLAVGKAAHFDHVNAGPTAIRGFLPVEEYPARSLPRRFEQAALAGRLQRCRRAASRPAEVRELIFAVGGVLDVTQYRLEGVGERVQAALLGAARFGQLRLQADHGIAQGEKGVQLGTDFERAVGRFGEPFGLGGEALNDRLGKNDDIGFPVGKGSHDELPRMVDKDETPGVVRVPEAGSDPGRSMISGPGAESRSAARCGGFTAATRPAEV
jgi:hypothetical protein